MTITPNLQLTIWDSPSDEFDPIELADNFRKIDNDYTRTRPTDRVEILTSLPGSGNFDGRLVYLTAANGGFPSQTVVRYAAGSWKAVGPAEVHASLPVTGNFAGRMIMLSASSGGFTPWTLVVNTDGAGTWQTVGTTIDIVSSIPVSGNYAGRLVTLSNADGAFKAWDLIHFDGSMWHLIGPQPPFPGTEVGYRTISSTITTTNTADPGAVLLTFDTAAFENVKYYLEISIPFVTHTVNNTIVQFRFREGTTNIGNPVGVQINPANIHRGLRHLIPFTPTQGTHVYNISWWSNTAGTSTITATSWATPIFRIFKA